MATQQAFEMKHWHGGQDFRDPKPNELRAMTMIVTRIKMYYQTPQTKADLVKYARVMYSHLPADEKPKGPVDVKQWAIGQVRDFYTALWENYPMIVIDHVAGPNGAPGRTQREVGQPHNFGRAKLFFNSNEFGKMMACPPGSDDFDTMAAFLILTGGHEHTHQFISYVGKGKIDTPPEFKISWYPGPEAGAYFEMDRTRGIAEMIPNEDDPMKVGTLCLVDSTQAWRQVPKARIQEICAGDFTNFPIGQRILENWPYLAQSHFDPEPTREFELRFSKIKPPRGPTVNNAKRRAWADPRLAGKLRGWMDPRLPV